MRLSDDKARRLSMLVWRERARRWLPIVLVAVVLLGGFTVFLVKQMGRADRTVDVTVHDGTVVDIKKFGAARGAAIIHVRLDDGRDVEAFSAIRVVPPTGAHVVINEARHASGKLTFDITRLAD
jgi:hypothetical protein